MLWKYEKNCGCMYLQHHERGQILSRTRQYTKMKRIKEGIVQKISLYPYYYWWAPFSFVALRLWFRHRLLASSFSLFLSQNCKHCLKMQQLFMKFPSDFCQEDWNRHQERFDTWSLKVILRGKFFFCWILWVFAVNNCREVPN